jgi:hypothetical protein
MYIGHETDRFLVDGCTFFMKTRAEPLSMDAWMDDIHYSSMNGSE